MTCSPTLGSRQRRSPYCSRCPAPLAMTIYLLICPLPSLLSFLVSSACCPSLPLVVCLSPCVRVSSSLPACLALPSPCRVSPPVPVPIPIPTYGRHMRPFSHTHQPGPDPSKRRRDFRRTLSLAVICMFRFVACCPFHRIKTFTRLGNNGDDGNDRTAREDSLGRCAIP